MEYALIRGDEQIASIKSPTTRFTDTGLKPDTQYQYVVFARAVDNLFSQPSNMVKPKTRADDGGGVDPGGGRSIIDEITD